MDECNSLPIIVFFIQVVLRMTKMDHDEEVQQAIARMASRGLRALGVARSLPMIGHDDEKIQWQLVGLISLLDPPRPDSAQTIAECRRHGMCHTTKPTVLWLALSSADHSLSLDHTQACKSRW